MAIYKRPYTLYTGKLTAEWSRLLVLPRFIYRDLFSSKIVTAFFVSCFVAPVGAALIIYLRHNVSALQLLDLPVAQIMPINGVFFLRFLAVQGFFAFLLAALVGPGLVSMDLTHNALPLYLCRPFTRSEYVVGKMSVLVILLSLITWIPGLLLLLLHSNLEGWSWLWQHPWILSGILLGSWIWILVLSLLSLALSAWVKWKPVAGAMLFGVFFVAAAFGEAVNQTLHTRWGKLMDLAELIRTVWSWLFGVKIWSQIPVWSAWLALLAVCAFCLLLLSRKLRAYEVIS
ncbi:MAG: hypothetical protein ACE5JX_13250 [Acidobacteriota bacterium]